MTPLLEKLQKYINMRCKSDAAHASMGTACKCCLANNFKKPFIHNTETAHLPLNHGIPNKHQAKQIPCSVDNWLETLFKSTRNFLVDWGYFVISLWYYRLHGGTPEIGNHPHQHPSPTQDNARKKWSDQKPKRQTILVANQILRIAWIANHTKIRQ